MSAVATLRVTLAFLLSFGLGCFAQTDQLAYSEGEAGVGTFHNTSFTTAWLGGCNHMIQQHWDGARWVDQGGEFVCVWEGLADPVKPSSKVDDDFTARDAGRWRLSYQVGFGCAEDAPLSAENCRMVRKISSNPFEVRPDPHGDQDLCEETGGRWDPTACGHRQCGSPITCLAIIPGCDCGPTASFVEGRGCIEDPTCSLACGGLAGIECPRGMQCLDAPGDSCGPVCGADCGGICAFPTTLRCGGLAGTPCSDGLICLDDPRDDCDPECGGADCGGICVLP